MQLGDMRTVGALRGQEPAPEEIERLSDRVLGAAAQNPDHSEAARAAAAEALRARHITLEPWRLRVPSFITNGDLAKGDKLFFGWGRAVRKWSGALVFASLLGLFAAVAAHEMTLDGLRDSLRAGHIAVDRARGAVQGISWADSAAYLCINLFTLSVVTWFFATIFRRKPARVLLLRKFNMRAASEPLERMLAQELRPYGHIASLSDKHIKRDAFGWLGEAILSLSNPLAAIWFVLGMPVRFVWRLFDRSAMGPAVVLNARDYRNLAKRLRDRIGLNAQVALVSKEAFLVRTSDAWWRMVVRLLMESSDAIVVDLSQVTEGTAWELDVIAEEGAAARCVFVSLWGKLGDAEAALQERGIAAPVFYYAPDGEMQRRPRFRAAMLGAIRATHGVA